MQTYRVVEAVMNGPARMLAATVTRWKFSTVNGEEVWAAIDNAVCTGMLNLEDDGGTMMYQATHRCLGRR
jgi:hypothetical protein